MLITRASVLVYHHDCGRHAVGGSQWAATGKVTLPIPNDFPPAHEPSAHEPSAHEPFAHEPSAHEPSTGPFKPSTKQEVALMNTAPLVSVAWLNEHLSDPNLVILDATIAKIGEVGPHPLADRCIPGARCFDLNGVFSDKLTDLPHNLPSPEVFTQASRQLGINADSKILVYDHHGVYSSPRAWWMFRAMGHEHVTVLDGGLPKWIAAGLPTLLKSPAVALTGDFTARLNSELVCDSAWIIENLKSRTAKIIDARSSGRFCGREPEPRAGLSGGHIPDSVNLPFDQVLRDGQFLPKEELATVLQKLELGEGSLAFTCGSGLTACIIMLACELVLPNPKRVYDGSWAEWGQPGKKFPIAK